MRVRCSWGMAAGFCMWLRERPRLVLIRRPLVLIFTLGSPMSPTPPVTHLEHETTPKIHVDFLDC